MRITINNNNKSKILRLIIILYLLFFIIIPYLIVQFLKSSFLYDFYNNNHIYFICTTSLFIYFYLVGIYRYKIKFEDSSFLINSKNILNLIGSKLNQIELSNDMLRGFKFLKRNFFLTDILIIKIISDSGKKSAVRIPITLLRNKNKEKIISILENIVRKNK